MIRRDYLLRMIEEFFQVLSRLKALKQGQLWKPAADTLEEAFNRLVGAGAAAVAQFSETELLARIIQGEPTQVVHQKTLMLATLLKEAGDIAAGQGAMNESRACYMKGLHLLLNTLAQGEISDWPEFVPKVDLFLAALQGEPAEPLPLGTQALLMQHYERTGQYAKAEDALFHMLDTQPDDAAVVEFGIAFYERLGSQSDACLRAGNLPREELQASLTELHARQSAPKADQAE